MHLRYRHSWIWLWSSVGCLMLLRKLTQHSTDLSCYSNSNDPPLRHCLCMWFSCFSIQAPIPLGVHLVFFPPPEALLCISLACDRGTRSTRPLKETSLFSQVTKWVIFEVLPDITAWPPVTLSARYAHTSGHLIAWSKHGHHSHTQRVDLQYLKNVCSYSFPHRIVEPKMSRMNDLWSRSKVLLRVEV